MEKNEKLLKSYDSVSETKEKMVEPDRNSKSVSVWKKTDGKNKEGYNVDRGVAGRGVIMLATCV